MATNRDKSTENITISVTTIYKPTYANEFYKLPEEPVKYWANLGIHIGRCLGEGTFAAAYEGHYGPKAQLPKGKENLDGAAFAVKVIHVGYHPYVPGAPNKDKIDDDTRNEMNVSNRTDIIHKNIIEFHFTAEYPPQTKTVCDHVFIFMAKAMFPLQDLLNCLIKLRAQVPINVGVRWIRGIANGLQHLHSIGIVHNDLHTYNVFVFGDSEQQVGNDFRFKNIELKIADFGKCADISKESTENKASKTGKDIERASLMFITMCDRIAFSDDNRKKCVDVFNQCYQKKISIEDSLKSKLFITSSEGDDWTIFVAQLT